MWIKIILRGNYKWLEMLGELVNKSNRTKHRTIRLKPEDVTVADKKTLSLRIHTNYRMKTSKPQFKIGDTVQISNFKQVFGKGSELKNRDVHHRQDSEH